jgi:hypothetical protein
MSRGLGAVERKLLAALRAPTVETFSRPGSSTPVTGNELAGGWYTVEQLLMNASNSDPAEVEYAEQHWGSLMVSWRRAARSLERKGLVERSWLAVPPWEMAVGQELTGPRRFHVLRLTRPVAPSAPGSVGTSAASRA